MYRACYPLLPDARVESGLVVTVSGLDLGLPLAIISSVMFHDRPAALIFATIFFQFIPNQERFHGISSRVRFRLAILSPMKAQLHSCVDTQLYFSYYNWDNVFFYFIFAHTHTHTLSVNYSCHRHLISYVTSLVTLKRGICTFSVLKRPSRAAINVCSIIYCYFEPLHKPRLS